MGNRLPFPARMNSIRPCKSCELADLQGRPAGTTLEVWLGGSLMVKGMNMRKYFGTLMVAGIVGLVAGPAHAERTTEESVAAGTVAVQRINLPGAGIRDEAAMVLVGTALIGLAAAVRRAA